MAFAPDGTLYASDPRWRRRDGQVWRIVPGADGLGRGEPMTSERKLGTTNGIDLSPDGKTLYVGESETRVKTIVSLLELTRWMEETTREEQAIKSLRKKQEGVLDK